MMEEARKYCPTCLKPIEQELKRDIEQELWLTTKLLDSRNKVMDAIPPCSLHGHQCVPHALEWIEKQIGQAIGPLTIAKIQISGMTDFSGPEPPYISMAFLPHTRFGIKPLLELVGKQVEITVRVLEDAEEQHE